MARIGLQAAEALAYAHGQGLVHRDVKPSNLLLDTQGTVWVTDFGLAKAEGMAELTHTGDIIGTLRYMAPERFNGAADPRSDVYSLGLTLYELLTLRPAFEEADRSRLIKLVLSDEPPRPRQLDRHIPRDLETVVLKAAAKEPGRRYATARELADDLRRFLADRPIRARRAPAAERAWRWCRRNPALALASTATAALVLAVAVVSSVAALWLRDERNATRKQLRLTERAEHHARQRLYEAKVTQAKASRWGRRAGQRLDSLSALAEAARLLPELDLEPDARRAAVRDLRNEAIAAMTLTDLRPGQEWKGMPPGSTAVAFDATLERYARGTKQGAVSVRRVGDDRELVQLPGPGLAVSGLSFSPNGRFLVAVHSGGLGVHTRVWDWEHRQVVFQRAWATAPGFSPDGRQMAVGYPDGSVRLHELASGKEVKCCPGVLSPPTCVRFDPTGERLAVWNDRSPNVPVVDLHTGQVAATLAAPEGRPVTGLAWHPGGRMVATSGSKQIYLWDLVFLRDSERPAKVRAVLEGHQSKTTELRFGDRGDLLLSNGYDGFVRFWDPWTGRQLLNTAGGALALAADGRLALQLGTRLRVVRVIRGGECRPLYGHEGPLHGGAFSPDGRLLATAGPGVLRLWDAAAGAPVAALPSARPYAVWFERPTGDLLTGRVGGLYRWRVAARDGSAAPALEIGPPQPVALPVAWRADPSALTTAFTPDGRTLVTTTGPDQATLLHLDRPEEPVLLGPHPGLWCVAISPDARWVATGPWNTSRVCVWDARTGRLVRHLAGTEAEGRARVAFSPDGHWLVTGTGREFRLWRAGTWEPSLPIPNEHGGDLPGIPCFSPDGSVLALADPHNIVKLIDPRIGEELATLDTPDLNMPTEVQFSPDGSRLLLLDEKSQLYLWDLRRVRRQLAEMGLDCELPPCPTAAAEARPAGAKLLPYEAELRRFEGHTEVVWCLAFSADGRRALSSGRDGTVRLWEAATGRELRCLEGHTAGVWSVVFSPDGRRALSAAGAPDGSTRLWDLETGKELRRFPSPSRYRAVFAPDGRSLLTAGRETLLLLDLETGREGRRFTGHTGAVNDVIFLPDGRRFLSGGLDQVIRLWDVETGRVLRRFEGHTGWVRRIALAPDARTFLSASWDTTLRLWDVETGRELRRFEGHTEAAEAVAFSSDGRYALSAGRDGTMRLWQVPSGREIRHLFVGPVHEVLTVGFAPDGRTALSGSIDQSVRLWDVARMLRDESGRSD